MTLDEAIVHAKDKSACTKGKCASDHAQLALWLEELKELRANRNRAVSQFLDRAVEASQKGAEKLIRWDIFGFPRVNMTAMARSLFQIEKLPDGALPIYDCEPDDIKTKEKD